MYGQRLLLFDGNIIKIARKPGTKQKENLVWCTREGKRSKGNIREGSGEGKTGFVFDIDKIIE